MARRKRYGSGIEGAAAAFEDLPLIASPIAAGIVLIVLVWLVPWLMTSQRPSPSGFNYLSTFAPLLQWIGVILAVAILAYGLKGAGSRALDRWLESRHSRAALDRAAVSGPKTWRELEQVVG